MSLKHRLNKIYEAALSPKAQELVGIVLFFGSVIFWPVSAITWASNEPPTVLNLSWAAIIFSAYCILVSARTDRHVQEK